MQRASQTPLTSQKVWAHLVWRFGRLGIAPAALALLARSVTSGCSRPRVDRLLLVAGWATPRLQGEPRQGLRQRVSTFGTSTDSHHHAVASMMQGMIVPA